MNFPIEFKFSDSKINVNITLQSMVTLICEDSTTGKTLIAKHIHADVQETAIRDAVKCSIDLNKVYV